MQTIIVKPVRWQDFLCKVDPLDDKTLRWNDILRVTGLGKSQLKLKIDAGEFPCPFLISDSGRALGWHSSEVLAWCTARDAHREAMKGLPRGTKPPQPSDRYKKPRAKKAVRR